MAELATPTPAQRTRLTLIVLAMLLASVALIRAATANVSYFEIGSQVGTLTVGTPGSVTYAVTNLQRDCVGLPPPTGTCGANLYLHIDGPGVNGALPTGVTYQPNAAPFDHFPDYNSQYGPNFTLTISTTAATPAGSYPLTVKIADNYPNFTNAQTRGITLTVENNFGGTSCATFEEKTTGTNGAGAPNSSSLTLDKPSGAVVGDVLIADVTAQGGTATTFATPDGWHKIATAYHAKTWGAALATFWHTITAADATVTAYTFEFTSTSYDDLTAAGGILRYSGLDTATPVDTFTGAGGEGAYPIAPSVTPAAADETVLAVFGVDSHGKGLLTAPAGMTELLETNNPYSGTYASDTEVAEGVVETAGSTGTLTLGSTSGNGYAWAAQTLALKCQGPALPTETAISAVSGSGYAGGTASLTATLKAGTTPIDGATIAFTLSGSDVGTATTNASGVATKTGVNMSGTAAGTYSGVVGASFAGAEIGGTTYAASGPTTGDLTVGNTTSVSTVLMWGGSISPRPAQVGQQVAFPGGLRNAVGYGAITDTNLTVELREWGGPACDFPSGYITRDEQHIDASGNVTLHYAPTATGTYYYSLFFVTKVSGAYYYGQSNSSCQGLTVVPAKTNQTITFAELPAKTYGDADFTVSASASSGLTVSFAASGQCTMADATTVHLTGAGSCTITASQAGNGTYNPAPNVARTFAIGKAPLTVTAQNRSINFLQSTPGFAVDYSGFVLGETAAALTGAVTYTFAGTGSTSYASSTTPPTHAGTYSITPGSVSSDNYDIVFVAGAYTINPVGQNTQVGWYGAPSMTPNPAQVGQQVTFTGLLSKPYVPGQSDTISDTNLTVELVETNALCQPLNYHVHGDTQHIDASGHVTLNYTPPAGSVGTHVFGLFFAQQDSGDYRYYQSVSSGCNVLTVVPAKTNQTITFVAPTGVTTDTADFDLAATASSGLTVSYTSSTTDTCTIVSGKLHVVAAGDCTVTAHQGGNASYNPAPDVERTFTIAQGKSSQTIDFTAPTGVKYGDADSDLGATATSNLAVSYASSTTGKCTIVEGKLHVVAAGGCTITASQGGNESYKAAPDVSRTFTIAKVPLSVTADADPATADVDGFGKAYAVADPTFTVRYVGFVNSETEGVLGGTVTFTFEGTGDTTYTSSTTPPTDVGTYSVTPGGLTSSNYDVSFAAGTYVIGKSDQTISFTAPSNVKYGDLVSLGASADSGLDVKYASSTPTVCSIAEPIIIIIDSFAPALITPVGPPLIISGTGDCTIVASQPGDDNYNAAQSVSRTFTIGKAPLSVTADADPSTADDNHFARRYGAANPDFNVRYDGFVGREDATALSGTLAFDTTATTSSPVGAYAVTPKGLTSNNYDITFIAGTLDVGKANQEISFPTPTGVKYGDADFALGATASSGLAVTYASSTQTICTIVAGKLHVVAAGNCTITASQAGGDNYNPAEDNPVTFAISKASQTITFTPPIGVKYGDANSGLGATASSGLAVSYASSTTSVCTIVSGELHVVTAGDCTVTASQVGNVNYDAATDVTKTFTIGKASQTITFAPLTGKTYGDPDFTVSATASSGLAVTFAASGKCEMVNDTTVRLTGVGSCTITGSQAGDDNYKAADDVQRTFSVGTAEGVVNYIGQTLAITSGPNSTTAKLALTASVQGDAGDITNARVTFIDDLTGAVLAKGVPVTAVQGGTALTGTANTVVTLSSGKYGAQTYLVRVRLDPASGSWYDNDDQIANPGSAEAAYATVTVMVPGGTNTAKGDADLTPPAPAGNYAAGTNVHYTIGLKYNKGGSSPQGQIFLTLDLGGYRYYVKSNSITSVACTKSANPCRDLTIYTKASIYRVNGLGITTSIDGNVTLRVDLHDAGDTSTGDTIGFTVLSSKNSTLYYSNNWAYDNTAKAWRTVQQPVTATGGLAVVIN